MSYCNLPGELLIVAVGTLGDVEPFAALGGTLRLRGYAVRLLSNVSHEPLASRRGIAFTAIAGPHPPQDCSGVHPFHDVALPTFAASYQAILERAKPGVPLSLVAHDLALGAIAAAEKLGCPCIRVVLAPCGLGETRDPCQPSPHANPGELQAFNAFRCARGLAPLGNGTLVETLPARLVVGLFSSRFAPLQTPAPNVLLAGFPSSAYDDEPLDPALVEFIDNGAAPVVFTPGTGVTRVTDFFEVANEVCASRSLRAIFLGRGEQFGPSRRETLRRLFVPLDKVLPKSRLIIHHGGIGTVAAALRAGIAQVIVPERFDQPDNGQRVARLGLGVVVRRERFGEDLGKAIEAALAVDRGALSALATHLKNEDGLTIAADAIDASLRGIEKLMS